MLRGRPGATPFVGPARPDNRSPHCEKKPGPALRAPGCMVDREVDGGRCE